MSRILIIGATGTIGREIVPQLANSDMPVRAMVRQPDAARLPTYIEVMRGDLTLPETLDECLIGVDTLFLVWTAPPSALTEALKRIAKHTRRIVFLSAPLKTPHPFFQQPNPSRVLAESIERMIEASGVAWTFLRPGMFAANALRWWAPAMRANAVIRWPCISAPTAPIHERDIAAVAVRVLCEEFHAGAEYVLTGPESLSQLEQISTIGRVVGRALQIEEMTPDEARRAWGAFMPASVANMLLDAWIAALGQPAYVTSTVEEITGVAARTFHDWATDHAADFACSP